MRLVDEFDCGVAVGEVGEMIVRTDRPWGMVRLYKQPDATAAAWRNGWFHTGDCFRVGEDGYYYFVDRMRRDPNVGRTFHPLKLRRRSWPTARFEGCSLRRSQ